MKNAPPSSSSGFTLPELLVAIVLIAALVGILLPVIQESGGRSRSAKCIANLHGIGVLISLYGADHQMRVPVAYERVNNQLWVWHQRLWPYAGEGTQLEHFPIFTCPSRGADLYSYAFERIASKGRIGDLAQNLENGRPVIGKRWLVMDSSWYFMDRAHGVNGATGTARVTARRHQNRANFLFPDFSVASLNKTEMNSTLYNFMEFPIP